MIIVEPTLQKKVKIFLENRWNIVDGIGLLSFLPGLVMRTQPSWGEHNHIFVFHKTF